MSDSQFVNYSSFLPGLAARLPDKHAIICAAGRRHGSAADVSLTFAQLAERTASFACGLRKIGVGRGMRVVLMVRPGLDFLPLTFALLQLGAVPVLIDPGMGRRNLLRCIRQVQARAFIGIPLAHLLRRLFPRYFATIQIAVVTGRRRFLGSRSLSDIDCPADPPAAVAQTTADDPAAIIFTTGSTGPPKGVCYTHGMFTAQCRSLRQTFSLTEDDVDLAGFALFALFTLPMGVTVVLPDMDPTRPAKVVPERIVEAVDTHRATFSFGSPALWRRVGLHCAERGQQLASLRRVVMAGAPVPPDLHEILRGQVLGPTADTYTPYGATEALPVTCITGSTVLAETAALTRQGRGVCVGAALDGIDLRIVRISDAVLPRLSDTTQLPAGEIGEIIVSGAVVSRAYFDLPAQTELHKIYESEVDGRFWHRIGDVGYLDGAGRLWFCGRRAHRVETGSAQMFTVCCEAIFNAHPLVFRSALVGVGADRYQQQPVLAVEPVPGAFPRREADRERFVAELLELAQGHEHTRPIQTILFRYSFPVDIRHNAKIFREKLAKWAARKLRAGGDR